MATIFASSASVITRILTQWRRAIPANFSDIVAVRGYSWVQVTTSSSEILRFLEVRLFFVEPVCLYKRYSTTLKVATHWKNSSKDSLPFLGGWQSPRLNKRVS